MNKKQNQLWTWATLSLILATLSALCFAGCTYESKTKVSVDGGNPPTFKLDGSGHQIFFVVGEVSPANQVPAAQRNSEKDTLLWKIRPNEGTADVAWDWPPITYGKVPIGFKQELPAQSDVPQLVEGRVYAAGGPAYGANGGEMWFTIRDGKSVEVPKPSGY